MTIMYAVVNHDYELGTYSAVKLNATDVIQVLARDAKSIAPGSTAGLDLTKLRIFKVLVPVTFSQLNESMEEETENPATTTANVKYTASAIHTIDEFLEKLRTQGPESSMIKSLDRVWFSQLKTQFYDDSDGLNRVQAIIQTPRRELSAGISPGLVLIHNLASIDTPVTDTIWPLPFQNRMLQSDLMTALTLNLLLRFQPSWAYCFSRSAFQSRKRQPWNAERHSNWTS